MSQVDKIDEQDERLSQENHGRDLDLISQYSAFLAVIEVGVGSVVHGFKLPFGGQALSVNQGMTLAHASKSLKSKIPSSVMMISTCVAVLKSLSPAGNKLGPMLSISVQGALFAFGVAVFGANVFGIIIGMLFLSVWAFVQPFITLYLFFGHSLVEAIDFYIVKMSKVLGLQTESFVYGFAVIVLIKAMVSVVAGVATYTGLDRRKYDYRNLPMAGSLVDLVENRKADFNYRQVVLLALKDMAKPFFLISFVLMFLFFVFSRSEWSQAIWMSLRPLAIAFIFFFLSRAPWFFRLSQRLRKRPYFAGFFNAFDLTIQKLIKNQYGSST